MVAFLAFLLAVIPAFTSAATIDVQVGPNGQFVFTPENVAASPGDVVTFHFNPKNHSVTQSSFANPCGFNGGINSGFMPVAAGAASPTFNILVNDTQPIWLYCAQGARTSNSHCGLGMVFAINCGAEGAANSFSNFKKAALATASNGTTTPANGGVTIPPAPTASLATQVVSLGSSVWTTTYKSYPDSPGPTPASEEGVVHKVIVGGPGKLVYDPPFVVAKPRDRILFEFHQKNHTVTQSSFETPCRRASDGFDSGFMPVADDATTTTFPTYTLNITNVEPTFAYCRQTGHCTQGMVFAVNPVQSSQQNFQAFQDLAKSSNGSTSGSSSAGTPASTGSSSSDASQIKFGFAAFLFPLAFVAFAL